MASETVETVMMTGAEGMGFGNVYDEQEDAVISFVGRKDVLVLLPTGKR